MRTYHGPGASRMILADLRRERIMSNSIPAAASLPGIMAVNAGPGGSTHLDVDHAAIGCRTQSDFTLTPIGLVSPPLRKLPPWDTIS